ncbi:MULTISPECIES: hypothetical protein [Alteribacter]|uniref:Uncharacterized protein n=1 Tax=Alteribacter keqinensis TaxID=2483800 RepID=A0A3M7TVG3_9BACI|nr:MULTISPECIES: hypothetical protein [Alteribacter]MBM7094201.1 hypothetical protein [Alteribacter salitolerans]RNA69567.1 hypothetical protein EBO34_06420 [Alteribacter keqinensis]
MSGLKSIELQVALPRTQTAGKIQDQLQQRGNNAQAYLAKDRLRTDEVKRKNIAKTEKTSHKRIHKDDSGSGSKEKQKESGEHPYKGNQIDLFK